MNSRYTKHIATILTLVFIAILYSDVLKKLALDWWNDPNYSHGFLIPFISIYWIWSQRKSLQSSQANPSCPGASCPVYIWNIIHSGPHNRRAFHPAVVVCDNVGWIGIDLEGQGPMARFMGPCSVPDVYDPPAVYRIQQYCISFKAACHQDIRIYSSVPESVNIQ